MEIRNNTQQSSTVDDVRPLAPFAEPSDMSEADSQSVQQDDLQLFQPSFYNQLSESEGDIQDRVSAEPEAGSKLLSKESTQLPPGIETLVSNPRLSAEQFTDDKVLIITETEGTLSKLDKDELEGAMGNFEFEVAIYERFAARTDFSSAQASDATEDLMGRVKRAYVARVGQEVQMRVNDSVDAGQGRIQDRLASRDMRGDLYNLAAQNRGAALEPALVQAGLDHRTASDLASDLNDLSVADLRALRAGEPGEARFLGLGSSEFERIEDDYRQGLQNSVDQLKLLDERADTAQMKGRIWNEPDFKNVNAEVKAQPRTEAASAELGAHEASEGGWIAAEDFVKGAIRDLSDDTTVGKVVWAATDAVLARSDADLANQAGSLGLTDAETVAAADQAESNANESAAKTLKDVVLKGKK